MSMRRSTLRGGLVPVLCILTILCAGSFVGWKLLTGASVDTDILSLLPASQQDPALAAALRRLNEVASSRVALMVEGPTPQDLTQAAANLSDGLVKSGLFRPSVAEGTEAWSWLFAHRASLLCPADKDRLDHDQGQALAQDALTRWYSGIGISNSALLKSDPLLLTPRLMSCFLGPLAAPGANASIVSGTITAPVFATATQDRVKAVLQQWRAKWPNLRLYRAGAIFHADHAAASARWQMSLISAATGVLILVIYLLMFRSLRPALLAMLLIVSCLAIGLAATFAFYDRIHVMVIVFASALIGMVVDYSTYYLITGVARPSDSADARRGSIFRPLTLGMATSVAAFIALLASPIAAFRQIAVLGSAGLFAAWALALYLLPVLEGPRRGPSRAAEVAKDFVSRMLSWRASPRLGLLLIVAAGVIVTAAIAHDNVLDDVRRFQTPAPDLAAEETHIREATGFIAPNSFVFVTGAGADEAKRNEEALLSRMGNPGTAASIVAIAASRFDPSDQTSRAQSGLIKTKLLDGYLRALLAELNVAEQDPYAADQSGTPVPLPGFVGALRGQTGPVFWSIVPLTISASAVPPTISIDGPSSRLVDPAAAYSNLLGDYRWTATLGLVGGTVVTGLTLLLVYRRLSALWILLPTVLAMLTAPAILAIAGLSYSFFSAMALFLVVGAGVDYSIFQWEHRDARAPWTRLGIALAALMTCTSLGFLGLSSIYPVASFGMTVALGILLSLILSPLVALGFAKDG